MVNDDAPAVRRRENAARGAAAVLAVVAALAGCGSQSDDRQAASGSSQPPPRSGATHGSSSQPPPPGGATHGSSSQPPPPGGATSGSSQPQPPNGAAALPDLAAQDEAVRRLAMNGQPIYCGGGRRKLVALTFDDGPGPYTGIMLRQLRAAGARATFFLVGRSVARFPQWPRRERALAAIGDHTMTHPNLPALAFAAATREIADGRAAALRAAGGPVDLFRPPYGGHDAAIDREVSGRGMAEILWDVDSTDSRISPPADFHEIAAEVRGHVRPGSIVLMHENRGQTIRAVRSILPALKRRGLRAATVPELLAADPPSAAQLDAGANGCRPAGAAATTIAPPTATTPPSGTAP
jgi:peptidoglycan/xylan/chitin deacetylase (PgdA/CDA1 family)